MGNVLPESKVGEAPCQLMAGIRLEPCAVKWMPRKKTKGRYHAAEGWERCRVRVRAWCTIEMTSAMLIGTASAVAMFIPAMCLVVEMPSK